MKSPQRKILWHSDSQNHDAYAEARNRLTATGHIGGSMAGAVLGLNPYCSPMRAWLQLKGQLQPSQDESEAMWCGRHLEPALRTMLTERVSVDAYCPHTIFQHPAHAWMIATPDLFLVESGRDPLDLGIGELKTTSVRMEKHWTDGQITDWAQAQILHTMAVCGATWGYVGVLIGGQKFEARRVEAEPAVFQLLIEREQAFVDSLAADEPPALTAEDGDLMRELYPPASVETGRMVFLPEDVAIPLIDQYEQGAAVAREGEAVKAQAAAKLQGLIGTAEVAIVGERECRWPVRQRKEYVVPAAIYRAFSIAKRKDA